MTPISRDSNNIIAAKASKGSAELSRRRWLELMGASFALAGLTGCRWPREEIVPAVKGTGRVPGQALKYATSRELAGGALGLLVTSVDGRPIKIEGNPAHPASLGGTDAWAQAAILELYDPDRNTGVLQRVPPVVERRSWEAFIEAWGRELQSLVQHQGEGLRVLCEWRSSPTLLRLKRLFEKQFPQGRWIFYDPLFNHAERKAIEEFLGGTYRMQYRLEEADLIVTLDADLLADPPTGVVMARQFAARRDPEAGPMNRLYAVESALTLTGANADHRLPLPSSKVADLVVLLEAAISRGLSGEAQAGKPAAPSQPGDGQAASSAEGAEENESLRFLSAMADDLISHAGRSVVVAGRTQPAEVHKAVLRINALLGNLGKTVVLSGELAPDDLPSETGLKQLCAEMAQGMVGALFILGGNPVYTSPPELDLGTLVSKVPFSVHLGLYRDETSEVCTWHLPESHFLESWGDGRAWDGTYGVMQPLIEPLFSGRSILELVALLVQGAFQTRSGGAIPSGYDLVRETFSELIQVPQEDPAFTARWQAVLHEGYLAGSAFSTKAVTPKEAVLPPDESLVARVRQRLSEPLDSAAPELVFWPDRKVYDGRFANSGWLQELPDPITRLTWDNALIMSPGTAARLGVEHEEIAELELAGKRVTVPVFLLEGQADGSLALSLGYGRTAAGCVGGLSREGIPPVGVSARAIWPQDGKGFVHPVTVRPTGSRYLLASTEEHQQIDAVGQWGRQERLDRLVREGTLEKFEKQPDFAKHAVHHPPLKSLWPEHEYPTNRWGMSVDLSKCVGCGACVVACQAENNIPIVGRERVLWNREMHWIRVDRYFRGKGLGGGVSFQPVMCQQCENAPCEQVCPVGATVHSHEGLNDMVYNRCVGTRYCSNNCPYKVRRFNYFWYHPDLDDPAQSVKKMVFNPEVTIRTRGVMEKCTYCVQRIQAAKIAAKNARVIGQIERARELLADGAIQTACQQACPARAIEFGDLSNPGSRVSVAQGSPRAYALLGELNVKPRTIYLAKIRNPNPRLQVPGNS